MKADAADGTLLAWMNDRQQGTYADGTPFDEVGYLQCKLILKPDRFTSPQVFKDFAHLVKRAAEPIGVGYHHPTSGRTRPEVREVLFLDTQHFHLYNNAFIVRRRIAYQDGFPIADPEIVFKFRHPDPAHAAAIDVRPNIAGKYKIKYKVELLPVSDKVGSMRRLMSHNVEFGLSQAPEAQRMVMASLGHMSLGDLGDLFPPLKVIDCEDADEIALVNQTIVEELVSFARGIVHNFIGHDIGPYLWYVGSLFMFILFANVLGLMPVGIVPGWHPFTITSHLTVTGVRALLDRLAAYDPAYALEGHDEDVHDAAAWAMRLADLAYACDVVEGRATGGDAELVQQLRAGQAR